MRGRHRADSRRRRLNRGPASEFWSKARELASKHDAALIADEIQSGLGRTGRHFAYQKFDSALPDIVTIAKPLAGGLPLGAFIANEEFASAFSPGMHGSTFGGGPLACAAALEFLTIVEEEELLENVRARGAELRSGPGETARTASISSARCAAKDSSSASIFRSKARPFVAGSAASEHADQLHARPHSPAASAFYRSPRGMSPSFSANSKSCWRSAQKAAAKTTHSAAQSRPSAAGTSRSLWPSRGKPT